MECDYLGYEASLECAGAKVLAYEAFGSYQGDWLALVEYEGERGFVHGYYGSCAACDAFEGEFGYCEGLQKYDRETGKWVLLPGAVEKLAEFGREYLSDLRTTEEVLEQFERDSEFDLDAQDVVRWVKEVTKDEE